MPTLRRRTCPRGSLGNRGGMPVVRLLCAPTRTCRRVDRDYFTPGTTTASMTCTMPFDPRTDATIFAPSM